MAKFKTGIIGCGKISGSHAGALCSYEGTVLGAVCDNNPEKLETARNKYECRGYADYREMLADDNIDVVHICTPHYLHASMAIEAMGAGKHVFCEKPMAIGEADARKMIETADRTGKQLGVCFQNRYNPESVKLKSIVDGGEYGPVKGARGIVTWYRNEPYYRDSGWRGTWEREGGGVLINQAIHTVDLLQWLAGEPRKLRASVFTAYLKDVIEVEDTAAIYTETVTGARTCLYATNSYAHNAGIILEVACEKATFRQDNGLHCQLPGKSPEPVSCPKPQTPDVKGLQSYWGNSHGAIIRDFYRCIDGDREFAVDGREAIHAVRIVESAYRSSRSGEIICFSDMAGDGP